MRGKRINTETREDAIESIIEVEKLIQRGYYELVKC